LIAYLQLQALVHLKSAMYLFTRNGQPMGPIQNAVKQAVQFCIAEWDDVKHWLSVRTTRSKSTMVGTKGPLSGPLKALQRMRFTVAAAAYKILDKLGMCGSKTKLRKWCKLLKDTVVGQTTGKRLVARDRQVEIDQMSQVS